MNDAPEPFLQVRRRFSCCGVVVVADRYPGGSEDDATKEARAVMEIDAWAKNHRMTCHALKEHDDIAL